MVVGSEAFLMKTNSFTLVLYVIFQFLYHNKVNNLYCYPCVFIFCILTLILLYIVKSYKIFDFDFKSKFILTFIIVDFNYFVLYHKFDDNVKFHKTQVYDI